jgi:hypothetical protein
MGTRCTTNLSSRGGACEELAADGAGAEAVAIGLRAVSVGCEWRGAAGTVVEATEEGAVRCSHARGIMSQQAEPTRMKPAARFNPELPLQP